MLEGEEVGGLGSTRLAWRGVARTFQNIHLFGGLTVRENVEVGASTAARYRPSEYRTTDELLDQFKLTEAANRKTTELPYGRQREVEMARAVALGPDILLLDEPAAGMNEGESQELVGAIRSIRDQEKCAILLIDHDLHFVLTICERIYVLDAGAIIAMGTPAQIRQEPCVIQAYLGTRAAGVPTNC
jgi:branched-chain amino acid transport system ATP-binding protein